MVLNSDFSLEKEDQKLNLTKGLLNYITRKEKAKRPSLLTRVNLFLLIRRTGLQKEVHLIHRETLSLKSIGLYLITPLYQN